MITVSEMLDCILGYVLLTSLIILPKKITYLAKLTMAQGIPVGVLNAGNNLSPTSLAFTLKTWEKKSIITGR